MWWGLPVKLITTLWSTFSHKTSTLTMFWYWWLLYTNFHSPSFLSSIHRPKHFLQIFTKKTRILTEIFRTRLFCSVAGFKIPTNTCTLLSAEISSFFHILGWFLFWQDLPRWWDCYNINIDFSTQSGAGSELKCFRKYLVNCVVRAVIKIV